MSSTELGEWAAFFRENSFSDALLDSEFSALKAQVFMLATGKEIDAADFSLLTLPEAAQNRTDQDLLEVAVGIPGGVRFEPESR